jgi:hypothetical protein
MTFRYSCILALMTAFLMGGQSAAFAQTTYTIIGDDSRITINEKLVLSVPDASVTYDGRDITSWVTDFRTGRQDSLFAIWAAFPPLEYLADPLTDLGGPGPFRPRGGFEGLADLLNEGRSGKLKALANRVVETHIEVVLTELTKIVLNERESLARRDNAASALSEILKPGFNPSDKAERQRLDELKAHARDALKIRKDLSERRERADKAYMAEVNATIKKSKEEMRTRTLRELETALHTSPKPLSLYDAKNITNTVRIFYLQDPEIVEIAAPLLIRVLLEELAEDPNPQFVVNRTVEEAKRSREFGAMDREKAARDLGQMGRFAEPAISALRIAATKDPDKGVRKTAAKSLAVINKALKQRP